MTQSYQHFNINFSENDLNNLRYKYNQKDKKIIKELSKKIIWMKLENKNELLEILKNNNLIHYQDIALIHYKKIKLSKKFENKVKDYFYYWKLISNDRLDFWFKTDALFENKVEYVFIQIKNFPPQDVDYKLTFWSEEILKKQKLYYDKYLKRWKKKFRSVKIHNDYINEKIIIIFLEE